MRYLVCFAALVLAVFAVRSLAPASASTSPTPAIAHNEPAVPALDSLPVNVEIPTITIAVRAPAKRAARAVSHVETDAEHAARLLAARWHCGDTYDNDVGGRNADCAY